MPNASVKALYSCKRKTDFITFTAVALFVCTVLFELYLILLVPIQLKNRGALEKHVAKEEMLSLFDSLRARVRGVSTSGNLQSGEKVLVKNALDIIALYLRENQDVMTSTQIRQVTQTLTRYELIYRDWTNGKFHIVKESVALPYFLREIEKRNNIAPSEKQN